MKIICITIYFMHGQCLRCLKVTPDFVVIQTRLQHEVKKVPKLQKFWNLIKKNYEKMDPQDMEQ